MKKAKSNKGFSLVELVVVIAIMAILAGVAVPVYNAYIENSRKNSDRVLLADIVASIQKTSQDMTINEPVQMSSEGIMIPLGFIVVTENGITIAQGTQTEIHEMLKAAYGDSYATDLKLKSDAWSSDVPTFYKDADALWEKVETTANTIAFASKVDIPLVGNASEMLFGKKIDSAEGFVIGLANEVTKNELTEETFVGYWMSVGQADKDTVMTGMGFGLNGRENYAAARTAYNACFTSYMKTKGHDNGHAALIESYMAHTAGAKGAAAAALGYSGVTQVICRNAFEQKEAEKSWGSYKTDSYHLPNEVKNCSECRSLYEQYVTTDAKICEENARAFYKTMLSLARSSDTASATDDFFGYYTTQLTNTSNLYEDLNDIIPAEGGCAVITVYCINGVVTADISPKEADSKNN